MASLKFCTTDDSMNVQKMCAKTVTSTDFGTKFRGMSDIALLIPVDSFNENDVCQFAIRTLQDEFAGEVTVVDHSEEKSLQEECAVSSIQEDVRLLKKRICESSAKFLATEGVVNWTVVYAKVSDTHCWGLSLHGNKKKRKQVASLALHFVLNLMDVSKCEQVRRIFHLPASPNYQSPVPAAASTDGWNLEAHYHNHPKRSFHYHTASRPGVAHVLMVWFHGYDHNKKMLRL